MQPTTFYNGFELLNVTLGKALKATQNIKSMDASLRSLMLVHISRRRSHLENEFHAPSIAVSQMADPQPNGRKGPYACGQYICANSAPRKGRGLLDPIDVTPIAVTPIVAELKK